jgi:hypothetical protein
MSMKLHRADLGVTATLLALSAVLYWDTTRWPPVPPSLAQNAPPTVFPRLLIGAVVILSLLLPIERAWKERGSMEIKAGRHTRPKPVVALTALVLVGAVYLMPILGMLPVLVAASALLPLLWGERHYRAVAAFAIALPLAVTCLFAFALKVDLGFGITGGFFR